MIKTSAYLSDHDLHPSLKHHGQSLIVRGQTNNHPLTFRFVSFRSLMVTESVFS